MTPEDVVAAYQARYGAIRTAAVARAVVLWRRLGGLTDEEAARFVAAAVPMVAGAQAATAQLVAAYIATMARLEDGAATPAVIPAASVTTEALRGVAAVEVYRRPVVTARIAVAEGKTYLEALAAGLERVEHLAGTDVALAQREATVRAVEADERVVGYRRVLTGRSCAFCATASTQRYRRTELMPLHSRCDCGVAPIIGAADPGQVINQKLVTDLKAAARQSGTRDYWAARHVQVDEAGNIHLPPIKVHQHGELGPVLADKAHNFTGPASAAA